MEKKISNRQLAKNMQKLIGLRVGIVAGKYEGQKGFTVRVDLKNGIKPELVVKLDSGEETKPTNEQVMFLVLENGKKVGEVPEHLRTPKVDEAFAQAESVANEMMKNNKDEKPN